MEFIYQKRVHLLHPHQSQVEVSIRYLHGNHLDDERYTEMLLPYRELLSDWLWVPRIPVEMDSL